MNITCPSCRAAIQAADVNVSTDIALCRNCGRTFSLAQLIDQSINNGPDLNTPPHGAWFDELPSGFRTGASTASWMALFYVPFSLVWGGMSVGSIYGKQLTSGHFDVMSSLFGLPFLIGSACLLALCAMTTAGKIEIIQSEDRLSLFMGIGSFGWLRNFVWSDFHTATEAAGRYGYSMQNRQGNIIVLEGQRRLAFGSMLNEERRYFVLSALKRMLLKTNRISPPVTSTLAT